MIIKPSSELRNNFTGISKIVRERQEPVFLTKNGSGDMVLMSMEMFNEQYDFKELFDALAEGEKDLAAGRVHSWESVKTELLQSLSAVE